MKTITPGKPRLRPRPGLAIQVEPPMLDLAVSSGVGRVPTEPPPDPDPETTPPRPCASFIEVRPADQMVDRRKPSGPRRS